MLRFGIIGTNVISDAFVAACHASDGRAQAVGVHSRTLEKARRFAGHHGLGVAVDSLDALFDAVDAVYIATPIAAHRPQALAAIAAGRHVLVEKTMGVNAAEVAEILDAAAAAKVVAMEAVRNVHSPVHRVIREAVQHLGTVRHAHLEKLQYSSRYDAFRAGEVPNAFNPALGNSALADIGVYCLQPALDLFGVPGNAGGSSVFLANGFEAGGVMYLDHAGGVVELAWSKIVSGSGPSVIHGEDAALSFDDPADMSHVTLTPRGGAPKVLWEGPKQGPGNSMQHEVIDFAAQVEAGRTDPRWSALSANARAVMDAHLQAATRAATQAAARAATRAVPRPPEA